MQPALRPLVAVLGALALFVGARSYETAVAAPPTAAESSGAVARSAPRSVRRAREIETARERARATIVELASGTRGMSRDEVRRALQDAEAGTYIGELLLDRDSALTRWPERGDRPLTVWIGGGATRANWKDDFRTQVRDAFLAWQDVGLPVRFAFVADSVGADVHVTWTDRFQEPISGKTIWSRDDRWWIVDADITLALHHRDGAPLDASQVRAIALHEVGHLLGLDHTSDATSIMAPRVRVRDLSTADQATARLLYSVPARVASAPGMPPAPARRMPEDIFDVAIVGGGPAGLSAAIWLGRYLHSVVLIDSGDPRNWETRGVNGYLGLPGIRPAELRGAGREEARTYGVRLVDGFVVRARAEGDERFVLEWDPMPVTKAEEDRTGPGSPRRPDDNEPCERTETLVARRLLLCIGLKDVWPRVPGLEQVYGDRAHVCPDCDGHSTIGRKTVVLGKGRKAVGMALNLTTWTGDLVVCTNGEDPEMDDELRAKLDHLGIPVDTRPIAGINMRDDALRALRFADGSSLGCEKLFYAIGQYPADDLGAQLGCVRDQEGHVEVDDAYHTSVRNVFAAGDIVPGPQLGIAAAADGAIAALAIHKSLVPAHRKLKKQRPSETGKPHRVGVAHEEPEIASAR